jgi:fermentation-respiration switch protein FrsA (DUF1100 family)
MTLEDRFIYRPTRVGHVAGLGSEVSLTTRDGVKLHAIYATRAYAYFNLLFLHSSVGGLPRHRAALASLVGLGPNLLAVDYRGYGKSEGKPSEAGLYADALAAYEWLLQHVPAVSVIVMGEGLGTAPACELAATREVGALVLLSGFTNLPELAAARYPWLPTGWVVRSRFDNIAKLANVTAPTLIAHSRADERVPFDHGERLFAAAPARKQALWLEEARHREVYSVAGRPLAGGLTAFFKSLAIPG